MSSIEGACMAQKCTFFINDSCDGVAHKACSELLDE